MPGLTLPDDPGGNIEMRRYFFRWHNGPLGLGAAGSGEAVVVKWTDQTARTGRRTDQRAQFHNRFVAGTGTIWWGRFNQGARQLPERFECGRFIDRLVDVGQPTEHPFDVAIEDRFGLVVGDTEDRANGIFTNAGQREQRFAVSRDRTTEQCDNLLRGFVEVARPGIVTQPFPRFEHGLLIGRGEGGKGGEGGHPALVIVDHKFDACLLQHDLADPDRVGITLASRSHAPGQGTPMRGVPSHQQPRNLGHGQRRIHAQPAGVPVIMH